MQWICEESGAVFEQPVREPMNKPVICNGCGKKHLLKPGKLSAADLETIESIKREGYDDEEFLDNISMGTERDSVRLVNNWDLYGEPRIKGSRDLIERYD